MAYYDYEFFSSTKREENYGYGGVYLINCKGPPVASEQRTIIEDCRSVVYYAGSNHMPQQDDEEDYNGSWTKKTTAKACARATIPPSIPVVMKKQTAPVMTAVNYNSNSRPLNSNEAAKLYGGFVITEYGRKPQRPWA